MCGRTSLFAPPEDVAERFDVTVTDDYEPRYNIAPRDDLLVVPNDRDDAATLVEWGFVPHWADDPEGNRPINARAETVDEKPFFRDAFERRRCLVVTDGFYEWKATRGSKRPYRITIEGEDPFAFAGLWDRWEGPDRTRTTCTILTTDANEVVDPIHDRMPVVFDDPDAERTWLHGDPEARERVLGPYAGDDMTAYEVGRRVNDPTNDDPSVVEPVAEQSGLDDFAAD